MEPQRKFTLRCSAVFVSEGDETTVYRSLDEVPDDLRRRVMDRSRAGGLATIFIANRGGRRELSRRLGGLPSRVKTRLEKSVAPRLRGGAVSPPRFAALDAETGLPPVLRHSLLVAVGAGVVALLLSFWK